MRRQVIKAKELRLLPIPEELRRAMREVWPTVRSACKNPKKYLGVDDGIQTDRLIGGLEDTARKPFRFAFTPSTDSRRGRWYLRLDHTEVEDIGDGHSTELKMFCCTSTDCRMKFSSNDDACLFCDWEEVGDSAGGDQGHRAE